MKTFMVIFILFFSCNLWADFEDMYFVKKEELKK